MNKVVLISVCLMSVMACRTASALSITTTIGGSAPAGAFYVNFDDGTAGPLGISITPDAQIVSGSQSGLYAAPYVSGQNNQYFGTIYSGADTTKYVTTGAALGANPNAKVVLSFATAQTYLGLLWGSVDSYNSVSFYASSDGTGSALATVTGTDVYNANTTVLINPPNANQTANGTAYVDIDLLPSFQSVVFRSTQYAFEFDNVAYKTSVADGGSLTGVFGLCLLGLAAYARRRS